MGYGLEFLYFAAVVAILVRAFTHEEIAKEIRDRLVGYCRDEGCPFFLRKLAYMPTCEFCLSFWVTVLLVLAVFRYRLVYDDWRGYFVSTFVIMAVANVYMSAFNLLRIDLRKERAVAEAVERRKSA